MTDLVAAAFRIAFASSLLIASLVAQVGEVPGAAFLTASASVIGLVAIGQMVRAIARTESAKVELITLLQDELAAAHAEIRTLIQMQRDRDE